MDRASRPKFTFPDTADPWKAVWVAGLCSSTQCKPNALFYLMLVGQTATSHAALWRLLPEAEAKSAHRHPHGDVYEPKSAADRDSHEPSDYKPSHPDHVHKEKSRQKDIDKTYWDRYPTLLVGDPKQSYLWQRPVLRLRDPWGTAHHRFYRTLEEFLGKFG
jgi:hypothetical protein